MRTTDLSKLTSLVIAVIITGAPLLYAATPPDSSKTFNFTGPSYGEFIKVMVVLAVVILLVWLTLYILRKMMHLKGSSVNNVELVGGIPLGSRRSIQFLKVGNSLYVLGITDHHVGMLNIINDENEISEILRENKSVTGEPFSALLNKFKLQNRRGGDE